MTEIYLIRHGEAEGNVFRRLHGQYDSLLMPRGYAQRKYVEKRFENIKVDACFSSDLTRACITAESIYLPKNLPLQKDIRFREVNVGVWEDMAYGYLDNFHSEDMWKFSHDPKNWHVSGSETYEEYTDRFIQAMTEAANRYDGGTIAIFCHGAVLRGTLMRLFFDDRADKLPLSDNAGVSHIYFDNGSFTFEYLNDNSHIPEELSTFYLQSWWRKTDNRCQANLYFEPYRPGDELDMILPACPKDGMLITGKLKSGPVGILAVDKQQGSTGVIVGITLKSGMEGRYYSDQLLGCAISHFRRLGCTELMLMSGTYPEDLPERYGFVNGMRNIDPKKSM